MEADRFRNIVITMPDPVGDEATRIRELLDSDEGLTVHLRHPALSEEETAEILRAIPESLHHRVRLHDHFGLTVRFPHIGGVHLNSRNPVAPENAGSVSRSCHSIEEVRQVAGQYDYVTLSPVFESVSKAGYAPTEDLLNLPFDLQRAGVVALGGVDLADGPLLRRHGFSGMARMGNAWGGTSRPHHVAMQLQFITDAPDNVAATVAQAMAALEGGCRWTQIRMKDATDDEVAEAARELITPYRNAGAVLIVNDRVEVARRLGMDGVHIGKNDMTPSEARRLLGQKAIIGATANSIDDIMGLRDAPIDYLGVGPLRFTTTKKKLAPVIGFEGYGHITEEMNRLGVTLPFVAIGGITVNDIPALREAGVRGIAVSGAIAHSDDPAEATRRFLAEMRAADNRGLEILKNE
ncbi:MAG: thiamine phosphate synthase [Muribaculaceae bacterium]|nr:thiamine phosphate synthase [Muribaculaceae bacterium]